MATERKVSPPKPTIQERISDLVNVPEVDFHSDRLDGFISSRLDELRDGTQGHRPPFLNVYSDPFDCFISSTTEVRPVASLRGIAIDDDEIYQHFLTSFKLFSKGVDLADPEAYFEAAIYAAEYGQGYYFDVPGEPMPDDSLDRRNALLSEGGFTRSYTLPLFRFKGVAQCTERAAVAHNLLHFAGIKSTFLTGITMRNSVEQELHAFLLVEPSLEDELLIFDPTNPMIYRANLGGPPAFIIPNVYRGGREILSNQVVGLSSPEQFKYLNFSSGLMQLHKDEQPVIDLGTLKASASPRAGTVTALTL